MRSPTATVRVSIPPLRTRRVEGRDWPTLKSPTRAASNIKTSTPLPFLPNPRTHRERKDEEMRDPRGRYGQQAATVVVHVHAAEERVKVLHRSLLL